MTRRQYLIRAALLAAACATGATAATISHRRVPLSNKDLVVAFYTDVFSARDADAAVKYLRPDYFQHNPGIPQGLDGFRTYFRKAWSKPASANYGVKVLHVIAEGDLVVAHVQWSGTGADGKRIDFTGFDLFRVQGGKLAEHWDPTEPAK